MENLDILETEHGLAADLIVRLPYGLHARPSARISQAARNFQASIRLVSEDGEVDAKSMLDILSLAISHNDRVRLLASGPDAREALNKLSGLFTTSE